MLASSNIYEKIRNNTSNNTLTKDQYGNSPRPLPTPILYIYIYMLTIIKLPHDLLMHSYILLYLIP